MKIPSFRRTPSPDSIEYRVIYQAAAWCLQYPDDETLERLALVQAALSEQSSGPAQTLGAVVAAFRQAQGAGAEAQRAELRDEYIELFDMSRRQTLYLTYWSDGDTRRRGSALAAFKQTYRDSGLVVDSRGELPDYLPMVLEFAAHVDTDAGRGLLQEHRGALELIRIALVEKDSIYAQVLTAICATLPGPSPTDKASALAMRTHSPAVERVGLDAGDPRLLPLYTATDMAAMTRTPNLPTGR